MKRGDVFHYIDMCKEEGVNLQRGMNFRLGGEYSIILMSLRRGAPYADKVTDDGRTLIYEGHDVPKTSPSVDPKQLDQELRTPKGTLTQNGHFHEAAQRTREGKQTPEIVRVYEKMHTGVWVYNGKFDLVNSWQESTGGRRVYKFELRLRDDSDAAESDSDSRDLSETRLIPSAVKLDVWRRDRGRCVKCGADTNLHFDHIIPYSKGGSSLTAENIQILCAKHNLGKRDRIE